MNFDGCKRKFDVSAYVIKINRLVKEKEKENLSKKS